MSTLVAAFERAAISLRTNLPRMCLWIWEMHANGVREGCALAVAAYAGTSPSWMRYVLLAVDSTCSSRFCRGKVVESEVDRHVGVNA